MDPFSGLMFSVIPFFVIVVFIIVIAGFIFNISRGISKWHSNNSQPVLTVPARIVSKRTNFSSGMHHSGSGINHHHHNTAYYVTFEVESGDRIELQMDGDEYGLLVEGDTGKLTFQGTRYHGFRRQM